MPGDAESLVLEKRALPPFAPDFSKKVDRQGQPKINEVTKQQEDPLGWVANMPAGEHLRPDHVHWLSLFGALGIVIAFGHSILAMSGEETLAQVYRDVAAPKLRNFKRAAFIVSLYSVVLTGVISFFAIMIIPGPARDGFQDNLISGLAMNVVGPRWARLALNALVVCVGFLILAGAVNTSIIGANGVLNRVADDGVLPDWFQKPSRVYGTTWRLLTLIAALQVLTIVLSGGNVILLGEAYAFGVTWSLVFKALSMLVLRFTEGDRYRGYRVPLNVRLGRIELPVGLGLVFLVLLAAALANLMTKTVATISGLSFTVAILLAFNATERYRKRQEGADSDGKPRKHEHLEQFDADRAEEVNPETLSLERPYRRVVALESSAHLDALEVCLVETDPANTELVVVVVHPPETAGVYGEPAHTDIVYASGCGTDVPDPPLGQQDRQLMTAVVRQSELAGKPVKPVVVLTRDPRAALMRACKCPVALTESWTSARPAQSRMTPSLTL